MTVCYQNPLPETDRHILEISSEGDGNVSPSWGQAAHPDILQQEQLMPSWLPHLWHPALSLRLGCYGQPEAASQSQSLSTLPSSTDGSRKKKSQVPGGAKETFGDVLSTALSCHSSPVGTSIHTFRNDTNSHLGWAYAGHGSLLPIMIVRLLDKTIGGKGCRQVDRVTSHLAQAP